MFKRVVPWILGSYLLLTPIGVWAEAADTIEPRLPANLYPTQDMNTQAQQIPAGARIAIRFISALDAQTAQPGDTFLAETTDDLWAENRLIFPKGTGVRGRVLASQKAGPFSKGGMLRLAFDHLTMPTGELNPLNLQLDTTQAMFNREKNGLYTDPGVGKKLDTSVDKGIAQYHQLRESGMKSVENKGKVAIAVTRPVTAIAGFAAGTGVTTYNAAKAVFGRGETVRIQPGDTLILDFSQNATLPVQ